MARRPAWVSRRSFLAGFAAAVGFGIAACSSGARTAAERALPASGTFGGRVRTGLTVDELRREVRRARTPVYFAEARSYVVPFPSDAVARARAASYPEAVVANAEDGFVVLYQRCPHLGCRVLFCETSRWFECPCHAGRFDGAGEHRSGPSARGMTRFAATVDRSGTVVIDTGTLHAGPPKGTDTLRRPPAGPHCV
jgi:cytochrome b6-f complex iron-sulfur subunit